jgi:hypothetical protein
MLIISQILLFFKDLFDAFKNPSPDGLTSTTMSSLFKTIEGSGIDIQTFS